MIDELFDSGGGPLILDTESSLRFLESFTRNEGFVASFDCGNDSERRLASKHARQLAGQSGMPPTTSDPEIISGGLDDPLASKAGRIVELIKEVVKSKPRNSTVSVDWSLAVCHSCEQFFSPDRLRAYLELYWTLWHPNVNLLHRPTFDPSQSKAALVAAMAIIGASVSPEIDDNKEAKLWFNCVEEVVFGDDDFSGNDDGDELDRAFPTKSRLQSIQAAYMVCLFQNWEGSSQSKRRIRRFRYSTLVAVSHSPYRSVVKKISQYLRADCEGCRSTPCTTSVNPMERV